MGQSPKPAIPASLSQYVSPWTLKDGTQVTIRPIRPEDEPLMVEFHKTLSHQTVYLRYFYFFKLDARVAHERLLRICSVNFERDMVLVADHQDSITGEHRIAGVGRLNKLETGNEAEVAVLVGDQFQRQGLGGELLRRLIQVARDRKLDRILAEMLQENTAMQRVVKSLGMRLVASDDLTLVRAVLDL